MWDGLSNNTADGETTDWDNGSTRLLAGYGLAEELATEVMEENDADRKDSWCDVSTNFLECNQTLPCHKKCRSE